MMGLDPNLPAGSEYLVSSHRSVRASICWAGVFVGGCPRKLGSKVSKCLRETQHTPGAYPRHPQTPK